MKFEQYTQKSLEAVRAAQTIAVQNGHQELQQVHILLALITQEGGLTRQLLKDLQLGDEAIEQVIAAHIETVNALKAERDAASAVVKERFVF